MKRRATRGAAATVPLPSPPHKWSKYRLLAEFRLADEEYLKKTIHRFPWQQRFRAVQEIRDALNGISPGPGHREAFFVIKFVPARLAMLLPNFRAQRMSDLAGIEEALKHPPAGTFQEVWFCRTDIALGSFSVGGRILIDRRGAKRAQIIEQVWRCSPRLIESLDSNFPNPFIRASREGWAWSAKIEDVHRPASAPESKRVLADQFSSSLRKIDRIRERLECFCDSVFRTGVEALSLEYKIEGDNLQIIDWDTGDDSRVLRQLLLHEGA